MFGLLPNLSVNNDLGVRLKAFDVSMPKLPRFPKVAGQIFFYGNRIKGANFGTVSL